MRLWLATLLVLGVDFNDPEPIVVTGISVKAVWVVDADTGDSLNLVVEVVGRPPAMGWDYAGLTIRRNGDLSPDGFKEFDLVAFPPADPVVPQAGNLPRELKAGVKLRAAQFNVEGSFNPLEIRGVRVYGSGGVTAQVRWPATPLRRLK